MKSMENDDKIVIGRCAIMKKVLLSFVVFLLTIVSCMAQKHLTFKGIPIEGSMSSFCQKLVAKGFAKVQGSDKTTMFTGDFIFNHSIGRTDLGGSDKDMKESLEMIKKYPDNTVLYPGHGPATTLGEEKSLFSLYY